MDQLPVVLVTGASRGIGLSCLKSFARHGYRVIGTATTQSGADQLQAAIDREGFESRSIALPLDVTSTDSIATCHTQIQSEYSDLPLIVINNAGINADNIFLRMKDEQWDRVIETNLTGVFKISKAFIKYMFKKKWGRIINISSVVGQSGNKGQANYCAAKAGIEGMTRSLAIEYATCGITCNAIAPGFIATDMTDKLNEQQRSHILATIPMAKLGETSDISSAALFLASDNASYITGQTLHVNGGMYT